MTATPEEIAEHVQGVLVEWLPGYTCPEVGPQQRIRIAAWDGESVSVSAEAMTPFPEGESRFKIEIRVSEVR
jgi:hypothetical protein